MYQGFQDIATSLLRQFGKTSTLTKTIPGSFDPATGTDANTKTYESEVISLFVGVKFSFGQVRGDYSFVHSIKQGDSVVLVAPKGGTFVSPPAHYFPDEEVVPEQNDIIDGWTILAIDEVNPAGTVIIYKCHVRKQ